MTIGGEIGAPCLGFAGFGDMDTLVRLNKIFQEVFDDDEVSITRATTAKDIEGWDSLMHVTLMINVEKAFGIKFSSADVAGLKSVGELVDLISSRAG